ncbi:dTDP-4-dehydrorhamnose reductase [Pseudomonas sp. PDM15]|uniref:dTDP-4-dehydrorhamnose reductase n=1 Tax=Pseudomonas sp. PDM15 TaxID=2769303 RepID=UPI00178426D3|nr:dTDP-4-dehydrorhamnose reductase [Pseudomonas sp. PDM15]MBD9427206.1 dTDP-4-dehydrorhamnose reductase [Pseudomonas sp. PDM15]
MKIVLCGKSGQISRELQLSLSKLCKQLICLDRSEMDFTQLESIRYQLSKHTPDLIINTVAHTAVDRAESEQDLVLAINAEAVGVIAEEANKLGAPLIHYSTDYVFDGEKTTPYTEEDEPNPLGVYARSKLAGELAIQAVTGEHLILRTSWVYSQQGHNFLLTMQRLLQEREELKVVDDQIGAPTWAGSIAQATAQMIQQWQAGSAKWGTYHLTAAGETSWFGFASAISEQLRLQGKECAHLLPIASSEYPTPAKRPLNSRLDCSKLQADWHISMPDWKSALAECLSNPR